MTNLQLSLFQGEPQKALKLKQARLGRYEQVKRELSDSHRVFVEINRPVGK